MIPGEEPQAEKENRLHRYLAYSASLLEKYKGDEPFHLYLKKYFSANRKHGSRDRKLISSLCYDYFRLGFGVSPTLDMNEKFFLGIFLCEKEASPLQDFLPAPWREKINLPLAEKIEWAKAMFHPEMIFPFKDELSDQIDANAFCRAFLIQPKLFVRIRAGNRNKVFSRLKSSNVTFEEINKSCLAFSNSEKVSSVLNIDKEAVIQDLNSQRTGEFMSIFSGSHQGHLTVWDCCAASGGKSILAFDLLKNIELTVSDTRKNILKILQERFRKAGISEYHSFVADLAYPPVKELSCQAFDFIIADVPCTVQEPGQEHRKRYIFFQKMKLKSIHPSKKRLFLLR